jgi:large subunit ribosomal protein L35
MANKQKTHKGLLKRVKITGKNKVKHRRRGTSHLNSSIQARRMQRLTKDTTVPSNMARKMQNALGVRLIGGDREDV